MAEYTLIHSGTKDMRWYNRRYRNYDGTLTPEGKERYNYYKKKTNRVYNRRDSNDKALRSAKAKQSGPKVYVPSGEWGKNKEDLSRYTNKELKILTERARLEKDYREAFNTYQYTAGKKFIDGVIQSGKTVADLFFTASKVVEGINKFAKEVSKKPDDKPQFNKNRGGKNFSNGPKIKGSSYGKKH